MGFFSNLLGFGESKKTIIKDEINIMDAINAHIRWKIRLESYLNGTSEEKLDAKIIGRDDQCVLGKWIHGTALKHFQDDDGLAALRDHHAQFHVIAGEVVTRMQANDKAAAEKLLKGEYMNASRIVVRDLTELNKQLSS
jgi:Chemoreceptor zinc-binding domain